MLSRRMISKIGCLLLAISLWAMSGANAEVNLIKNPDFAERAFSGIAKFWKDNSGWANVDVSYQLVPNPDGSTSQLIECRRFHAGAVQFVQPGIAIRNNRAYRVVMRMKGTVTSPVEILLRKRGEPYTTYASGAFKVTPEWQTFSFNANVNHDDDSAYFMIRFIDLGRLYIDRAELVDISEVTGDTQPGDHNLIPNNSFEVGIDRWGIHIRDAGNLAEAMRIHYEKPKPVIASEGSVDGRVHVRIEVPENALLTLTSPYVETFPGNLYTVSCWVAAASSTTVTLGLGSGNFQTRKTVERTYRIGSTWKRIHFSQVLSPAPGNRYYLFLKATGPGLLRVDGVSFNAGDNRTPGPAKPAEIGFSKLGHQVIFFEGDEIPLATHVVNRTTAKTKVKIKAYDFWGKATLLLTKQVETGSQRLNLKFPSNTAGYFRLRGEICAGDTILDASELSIAVVQPPRPADTLNSPFGAHVRFTPEMLFYAKMLGVKWLRLHPPHGTKWFVVEKNRGQQRMYDPPIFLAHKMGFHLLGLLSESPRWASSAPANQTAERIGSFRSYPPEQIEDWRHYVYQTVKHYAGIIDHWEIWNEPDTNFFKINESSSQYQTKAHAYGRLLQEAYVTAKRANPKAMIIGGCASHSPPVDWIKKILREGAHAHMDVVSFHRYTDGRPGDAMPAPTAVYVADIRTAIQKYTTGPSMPIWESESGLMHPRTSYRNITEISHKFSTPGADGPAYLVRNYAHLLANGVQKWFYYHMFVSHRSDRREGAGFFEWDGSPRPLAVAYSVLANAIDGADYDGPLTLAPGFTGQRFRRGNQRINIVWKTFPGAAQRVQVAVDRNMRTTIVDIMGNRTALTNHQGLIDIEVGRDPIYVIETLP